MAVMLMLPWRSIWAAELKHTSKRPRASMSHLTPVSGGQAAACQRVKLSCVNSSGSRERSEEHTSELQSLMRISYAVFCLKKTNTHYTSEPLASHKTRMQIITYST